MRCSGKRLIYLVALHILMALACEPDHEVYRDYPLVETLPVDQITGNGARFNGRVTDGRVTDITEYGFVWGNSIVLTISDSSKVAVTGSPSTAGFSSTVTGKLEPLQKYYVRSFILTGGLVIYGNMTTFRTLDNSYAYKNDRPNEDL